MSIQTSGRIARSLSTLGTFWTGARAVLNLLLDSAKPRFASLLLVLHCDMFRLAVVCSGRGTSHFSRAFSNPGAVAWPDHYSGCGGRLLGVYHMAGRGLAAAAIPAD